MKKTISVLLIIALSITSLAVGTVSFGAVSKIKKNKSHTYLKLNKTFYDDGYKHTYKILAFNVNSKSAKDYNSKLYKYFNFYYKSDYKAYVNKSSLVFDIKGNTYKNGDIISIRQKLTGPSMWRYKAFNINKKTGKKVKVADLYKRFGYTKASFYNALKNKQMNKVKKTLKSSPGLADGADIMISYAKSSESRKGVQAYIDGSGYLCAIAKVNIYAGAGIYQYVFKMS